MDNYFQDIKPNDPARGRQPEEEVGETEAPVSPERSIRNVSINQNPARPRSRIDGGEPPPPLSHVASAVAEPRARGSRLWLWIIALLAIITLAFVGLFSVRPTKITITQRESPLVFSNTSVTAYPPANASSSLVYTIETMSVSGSASVKANGTERAESKASGTITIWNGVHTPIRLIKDTRFQSPDGKIFRIQNAIVVPAKNGNNPGKVSVTVVADAAGEAYNIPATPHFTIPGLKAKQEYDNVYGTSNEPFTGGFSGDRPAIAAADLSSAQSEIRTSLEKQLREQADALSTDSMLALPDLMKITYKSLPHTAGEKGTATITEEASAIVPLFEMRGLSDALAALLAPDAVDAPVRFRKGKGFAAAYAPESLNKTLGNDAITFILNGKASLVWHVDTAAVIQALLGAPADSFDEKIKAFPSIDTASARIMPPWKRTFPRSPENIRVEVLTQKEE